MVHTIIHNVLTYLPSVVIILYCLYVHAGVNVRAQVRLTQPVISVMEGEPFPEVCVELRSQAELFVPINVELTVFPITACKSVYVLCANMVG